MNDHNDKQHIAINRRNLQGDCGQCFGLCCIALYFSSSEGFPEDKGAGQPCVHLRDDYCCRIHQDLRAQGFKGCTIYDCFGAGQKVSQVSFKGNNWRGDPGSARQMFEVFLMMQHLHELLWYLGEALELNPARRFYNELLAMFEATEQLTCLDPELLLQVDLDGHRELVKSLLLKVSELVRNECHRKLGLQKNTKKGIFPGADLAGQDLKRTELRGANLRGACLIAADIKGKDLSGADLLGADLRDADIRRADLSNTIFLTQMQINAAAGDGSTKLPASLLRPSYW